MSFDHTYPFVISIRSFLLLLFMIAADVVLWSRLKSFREASQK
jgi:hypothetical protein